MSSQSVAGVRKRERGEGEGRERGGRGEGEGRERGGRGEGEGRERGGRGEKRCNIRKVFLMFSRVLLPMMTD